MQWLRTDEINDTGIYARISCSAVWTYFLLCDEILFWNLQTFRSDYSHRIFRFSAPESTWKPAFTSHAIEMRNILHTHDWALLGPHTETNKKNNLLNNFFSSLLYFFLTSLLLQPSIHMQLNCDSQLRVSFIFIK
jgi:hypothetical protein